MEKTGEIKHKNKLLRKVKATTPKHNDVGIHHANLTEICSSVNSCTIFG